MGFADDVHKWAKSVGARADQVPRIVAVQISGQIIERTPVDTGRAKGNWQATIETPASDTLKDEDKPGSDTVQKVYRVANDFKAGNVFYLVNNLPYIRRLEQGWSQQAPAGMVAVTVSEFQQAVARAATEDR